MPEIVYTSDTSKCGKRFLYMSGYTLNPKHLWSAKSMIACIKNYCDLNNLIFKLDFAWDEVTIFNVFFRLCGMSSTGTPYYGIDEKAVERHFKKMTPAQCKEKFRLIKKAQDAEKEYENFCKSLEKVN